MEISDLDIKITQFEETRFGHNFPAEERYGLRYFFPASLHSRTIYSLMFVNHKLQEFTEDTGLKGQRESVCLCLHGLSTS
ncbi:hypothetical protein J6590_105977 [Homalodisca vitripennis]|nr:hypothetical protein J6590_105977 [Homalodisca vitripennis]